MKHVRAASVLAAGVGIAFVLSSCTPAPPPGPAPATPSPSVSASGTATSAPARRAAPEGTPRAVATDLQSPWSVVFRNGTPLVSERDTARILELADDGTTRTVGTVDGVEHGGEGGLLGLAIDESDRLYVYSTGAGGNRIQRFTLTGAPGSLALGNADTIMEGIPAAGFHNGGRLAFGPDGMLYATAGDAGEGSRAQDLDFLGGKILRMTADGAVPEDNPWPGSLVYTYGHRNPQGLAWAEDGTMFATEFGQNTWDELNIITPGANYGWPTVEGIADGQGFTNPVQQWEPGVASPSGMVHVDGTLFIANLRGSVLREVPVADPSTSTEHYNGEFGRIRDVALSPEGDLWFLTNNTDGRGNPGPDDDRVMGVGLGRG
ncbi:PQQ-dependent sugar dehydrogenase [Paeniglutamicibacter sp. MACA_103]|uniref:PQQ-dependent sugar dehydrogenase n=1 Tax=Paeniglutamicibacter sp. MACA_103 TaxID=3377337 RepID=UPI003894A400